MLYAVRHVQWRQSASKGAENPKEAFAAAAIGGSTRILNTGLLFLTFVVCAGRWAAPVRGIAPSDEVLSELLLAQKRMRNMLDDRVFNTLEGWRLRAIKKKDVAAACVAHAHLAYLYRNTCDVVTKGTGGSVLTARAVTTILSAQVSPLWTRGAAGE